MTRGIVSVILSLIVMTMAMYRLWTLDQPRIGPVGESSYPTALYIVIYSTLFTAVIGLIVGLIRIFQDIYKGKNE